MKKMFFNKMIFIILIAISLIFTATTIPGKFKPYSSTTNLDDLDPLVDLEVTVEIQAIRSLQKFEYTNIKTLEIIDLMNDPDFFVKVFINGQEFESEVWEDTKFIYNPNFSPTVNVPDDVEFVDIKIQLWDWNPSVNKLCDIADEGSDVEFTYSLKTGHWSGDDELSDSSGYGRLNGCDDGSMYKRQKECELWFNV